MEVPIPRVEAQYTLRRLTPTARQALELAVTRAYSNRFYEVGVEHMLLAIVESSNDAALLLRHFGKTPEQVAYRLNRALDLSRTGNAGRPVLSESLFTWFEDAWLWSSIEHSAARLRTGALLAQIIFRPGRYTGETLNELEDISHEELRKKYDDILNNAPESKESLPDGALASTSSQINSDSSALKRFAISFTERAREGKIDPIFGRQREIRQMIDILARRRKNNPIIVGEPGVGKTALVEGLALAIVEGDVPKSLKEIELMGLDLGLLQAGATVKGEFENRLKAVINEVTTSAKPIVLFIDEAHTLIGAGGTTGGSDAANLLKPALARGELRTIAATTWSEFKKYFEKDAALERRFQPVKVEEPSEDDAILMLRGLRKVYESAHGVMIRDEAVTAAVRLSHRYISGRQLPDKAIDLLDTAAARVKTMRHSRPEPLIAKELEIAAIEREREALQREWIGQLPSPDIMKVEEQLTSTKAEMESISQSWEHERALVEKLAEARSEIHKYPPNSPENSQKCANVEAIEKELKATRGEEPLFPELVDAAVVASVVASWTGVPVGKLQNDRLASALNLEKILERRIRGQYNALQVVGESIRMAFSGIRNPNTPVAVLLFVGPSGVGKTETALALADTLFGGERFLININMSEFQEKHTVSRLIGSPPGYVGYGEGGILTEAVRQRPYSLVLLDECEKADLEVMNLFYQVFDKGQLSDGEGRIIDFRNTLIILTSNLASEHVLQLHNINQEITAKEVIDSIRPSLSHHFKPALLARMNIIPFAPISPVAMRSIMQSKLHALTLRLKQAHDLEVTFDEKLLDVLTERCTTEEVGARNAEHTLRSGLMPAISRKLLEQLAEGPLPPHLNISFAESGDWSLEFV